MDSRWRCPECGGDGKAYNSRGRCNPCAGRWRLTACPDQCPNCDNEAKHYNPGYLCNACYGKVRTSHRMCANGCGRKKRRNTGELCRSCIFLTAKPKPVKMTREKQARAEAYTRQLEKLVRQHGYDVLDSNAPTISLNYEKAACQN